MRKPGTDENNVQMSDVLCDFCRREWTEDLPIIEGHQGACICGNCLTMAYVEVVNQRAAAVTSGYKCRMCLEGDADREALNRANEPAWRSPLDDDAVVCRRCIKLGAGALSKDEQHQWKRPG